MHRSGVTCNQKLKDEFNEAEEDAKVLFVKVEIVGEEFVKVGQGQMTDSEESNFACVKADLKAKSPCYMLMKTPKKGKWLLIYFVPDDSVVKKKMMIASSYADLKSGLGSSRFVGEYPISEPGECTLEEYKKSLTDTDKDDSLLTWQEREEKETAYDCSGAMARTQINAVVGLPIPVSDDAVAAIDDFKSGKINTVIFVLDAEKETLNCGEAATMNLDDIPSKLPDREPRYVLHNYSHERDGAARTKGVFIYYCPDKSKPRLRMFYSTAKSNVLATIDDHKIEEPKRVEISLISELTTTAVLDELYPKSSVKKVFKKPKRQGKGRSKFHGSKFQAKG